ncbi:multiple cyclophane-containing RiPP AmcA [Allorhizocola rhizosphaerae]|uniref:multiple cyclophane-containing RiPP AmcA n=1 Tax=Allorhizocola rhizosphaerae TaxID=1872709 RepID=UPI000E3E4CE6|nr:multiple cyclophane-containing RiPP AmcA [Allorhizocola rhizosphaerae]
MSAELDRVAARIREAHAELTPLLKVARDARIGRDEAAGADVSAVCAWNHFENIPTFFNWNNRPR